MVKHSISIEPYGKFEFEGCAIGYPDQILAEKKNCTIDADQMIIDPITELTRLKSGASKIRSQVILSTKKRHRCFFYKILAGFFLTGCFY
ncbi:MAG TPA: hypothetical protein DDW50_13815 [Firmicutes bacterium]|nr:hypothetical protein [Bacillota bacterium]